MVGTSGQRGYEHKGLGGERVEQLQPRRWNKSIQVAFELCEQKCNGLKIRGFIPPFLLQMSFIEGVGRWHVSSENLLGDTHSQRSFVCFFPRWWREGGSEGQRSDSQDLTQLVRFIRMQIKKILINRVNQQWVNLVSTESCKQTWPPRSLMAIEDEKALWRKTTTREQR